METAPLALQAIIAKLEASSLLFALLVHSVQQLVPNPHTHRQLLQCQLQMRAQCAQQETNARL